MNKKLNILLALALIVSLVSCNKDDDNKIKVNHVGEKWLISSVEYNVINQSLTGQTYKSGTKADAGAFYLDGGKGTFDITVETFHVEDYFSYTDSPTSMNITNISQSVGGNNISQHVIAISGEKTATTMVIDGTITKQSRSGQFVLTATYNLVKQ